jgi:lactate dehydrogenase-like 2-hydroxyacid dehydrogenase
VITRKVDTPLLPQELIELASQSDGMITLLTDKITANILDAAPRCRVYANYAVGYDNFDVAAATDRGVALANTPGVLTDATADLAWALLFAAARHIVTGDKMVRERRFHGWEPTLLLGQDISGSTLGILGAGRIGTAMARRAVGFGMKILYLRPRSGPSAEMDGLGATAVDLDTLLSESDHVSIHLPLNDDTRHLIGARELSLMKNTAVLVNTGRGPVVDERALAEALRDRRIFAAGLDVYEREPAVEELLLGLPNVVLLPHIGSATFTTRARMARMAAENVLAVLRGGVPPHCVNPDHRSRIPAGLSPILPTAGI